jgi:hypothetical protein
MIMISVPNVPLIYIRLLHQYVPYDPFHGHLIIFGLVWSNFLVSILQGGKCGKIIPYNAISLFRLPQLQRLRVALSVIQDVEANSLLSPSINAWIALTATLLAASITWFTIERPL